MCILPELMGSWFTRPLASEDQHLNCCHTIEFSNHGPESGSMLAYDDKECRIEWFHLDCLQMDETRIPKGKWYCLNCRKKEKERARQRI